MEYVPAQPITLNAAIARAVAFNLETRVKEIEREIEEAKLRTSSVEMLPALDFDATHTRNSDVLSTTDDRLTTEGSATFTWNILDLGVSYSRAKQQTNEVLIAREHQRKAFQDIVRRVRVAYWRAAGAERLMEQVHGLATNIKIAMRESRALERSGANDVAKSVAYRREIVDSVRQALTLQRELRESRAELAELLNIAPGAKFRLASASLKASMPSLPMTLAQMEQHALDNRPELRIEDYNERMSVWQAREALFEMLPGAKFSAGKNYSNDQFNLVPNFTTMGFQLGMNLFDLFSGTSRIDEAEKRGELARRQRLATTLAVMTQTHMAYIQYRNASQQMRLAREVARADRRLAQLVASDTSFENTDYFEAVRIATRQLQSEMDEQQAIVELVTAHGEIIHSIGLDVYPDEIRLDDLPALTAQVAAITAKWESASGDLDEPAESPLDVLVNAMLDGGEPAPGTGGRGRNEPREARMDDGTVVPTERIDALNAFATASAGTEPMLPKRSHVLPDDSIDGFVDMMPPPLQAAASPAKAVANMSVPDGHVVQFGVFRNESRARKLRESLVGPQDALLHGADIRVVERKDRQGAIVHYVETAAISDRSLAIEMCAMLRSAGQDCITATR